APPDVTSHPRARTYRTALRQEVKEQPDFAGHYTLVQIGCGAGCVIVAIVEARSGRVFFPGALRQIHSAGWGHEPRGAEYRLSSRLLVVHGQVNSEEAPNGLSYFEWTGRQLKLLRFEARDPGRPAP